MFIITSFRLFISRRITIVLPQRLAAVLIPHT